MIDEKKIEEAAFDTSKGLFYPHERDIMNAGFKAGINWFLDNLWHDASEEPKPDKWLLTERRVVNTLIHEVHTTTSSTLTWDYIKAHNTVMLRWLYIDDLLKGGK